MARDLQWFWDIGYQTQDIYPFDMFPQTQAIETVICLTKGMNQK